MYLFDTNVLSEVLRPRPNLAVVRKLLTCDARLRFASEITRFELRFGAALRPNDETLWDRIEQQVLPLSIWLPFDGAVALAAADLAAGLRRSGQAVEWADLAIGATAAVHGLIVVTRNVRHFERLADVQVENWFPAEPAAPA